ncbi:MAG: glycosyltransferase family 1 protein [Synechococcaceae cyanobacterium]|nr:glycosyltransferase family 1 protein [Synechococcaceae cyanobacterium]
MKVAFVSRRPMEGFYSLESYFERVRASLLRMGVEVTHNVSPYISKGLLNRLRIIRFAGRQRADLVHVTGDIQFAAFGTDPARTVVTVADCGRLHQLRGWKRELLRQFWFRLPLRRVAAITVISQAVKEDLLHWVPDLDPRRIHVVPVSISPAFAYSPQPFNDRSPRILQVGTTPNKNIPRLAQALRGIECTLVIIGRLGSDQIQVLEENGIRVENHCGIGEEEVIELYRSADLVAFVSTLEGFGMPILEAQSVGRPVVTSNGTSMPYVAGDAAILVDPLCVASIREGVLRVMEDGACRAALIERGRRNVRRFDSDAIASLYLDLYRSLLETSGHRKKRTR